MTTFETFAQQTLKETKVSPLITLTAALCITGIWSTASAMKNQVNGLNAENALTSTQESATEDLSNDDSHREDFRGADLQGANLKDALLNGYNMSNAQLKQANMKEAQLNEANLTGANMQGVDLRGSKLRKAILVYADLQRTRLKNADFREANLIGANLFFSVGIQVLDHCGAILYGSTLDRNFKCDHSWNSKEHKKCLKDYLQELLDSKINRRNHLVIKFISSHNNLQNIDSFSRDQQLKIWKNYLLIEKDLENLLTEDPGLDKEIRAIREAINILSEAL